MAIDICTQACAREGIFFVFHKIKKFLAKTKGQKHHIVTELRSPDARERILLVHRCRMAFADDTETHAPVLHEPGSPAPLQYALTAAAGACRKSMWSGAIFSMLLRSAAARSALLAIFARTRSAVLRPSNETAESFIDRIDAAIAPASSARVLGLFIIVKDFLDDASQSAGHDQDHKDI